MTAPGSGSASSGPTGACRCFVCAVKALALAQDANAKFSDAPFTVNLVGCRRAHSISNKFDDRMVVFLALPAEEASQALTHAKIDDALIKEIADAAKAVNADVRVGRGVRLVGCSAVELEPGKAAAGHRVVAIFPITTDPGLVRLDANKKKEQEKLKELLASATAALDDLEAAKEVLEKTLLPDLKAKGEALNALPAPKKGQPKSKALMDAEKGVSDAKKNLSAFAKKFKAATSKQLDARIAAKSTEQEKAQKKLDAYENDELTPEEHEAFGARYAFRGKYGWEGDGHAYFPLGYQHNRFTLGQHHWRRDDSTVALTIGSFMGRRMYSGRVLKNDFWHLVQECLPYRQPPALGKADKTKRQEVALRQRHEMDQASREYLVVAAQQSRAGASSGSTASWIVLSCNVVKPDGSTVALPDDDEFEIEGDFAHKGDAPYRRSGKEVRLLYHRLAGKNAAAGLKIHAHHPVQDRPLLPAGSKVMPGEPVLSSGSALEPIRDDDQFEVEAVIGATNIHRGHTMTISGENVAKKADFSPVANWSTGCQVYGAFVDFNLFILFCGLSKRWNCLRANAQPPVAASCDQLQPGSETAPDPFVWEHAFTTVHFPPDALAKDVAKDITVMQKNLKTTAVDVKKRVDAWFKTEKALKRPSKDDEAATLMATTLEQRIAALSDPQDTRRPALTAERLGLAEEIAKRDVLDASIKHLASIAAQLFSIKDLAAIKEKKGGGFTYKEAEEELTALRKSLIAEIPTLEDFPNSKRAAEAGAEAAERYIETMKVACHKRAVLFKHDWLRRCDLIGGEAACKQKFSYTLVEIVGLDGEQSLDGLDNLFIQKAGNSDAYPKWSGFKGA